MKKVFALLISFSIAGIAMAQSSKIEEARRVIKGESGSRNDDRTIYDRNERGVYDSRYPSGSREARIDEINRRYDARIQQVRNARYLSNTEKQRRIRDLQEERAIKIREVNAEYRRYDNRNTQNRRYEDRRYDDRRYDDHKKNKNKKSKGNNGKHLGWEKGKGNPHRGRG